MFRLNVNIFLSHTCLAVHLSLNITMAHLFPALLSVWSVPQVLDMEVAGEPARGTVQIPPEKGKVPQNKLDSLN